MHTYEVIVTKIDNRLPFAIWPVCLLIFLDIIHHQQNKVYLE